MAWATKLFELRSLQHGIEIFARLYAYSLALCFRVLLSFGWLLMSLATLRRVFPALNEQVLRMVAKTYVDGVAELRARRPERIVLIRHGQSQFQADRGILERTPDNALSLTELGFAQAREAGRKLRQELGPNARVLFFTSPYLRTQQTLKEVILGGEFAPGDFQIREDIRLRELDFGQLQDPTSMDFHIEQRLKVGRFWYRPSGGEACCDLFDRMSLFLDSLFREIDSVRHVVPRPDSFTYDNVVIICHGLSMRLFCHRYFRWTLDEFLQVYNPENCETWVLRKMPDCNSRYKLVTRGILVGPSRDTPLPERMKYPRSVSGELDFTYLGDI
ncbi:Phosphoglycerate mutase-like protein AT74H [Porphyridium purpureum]|uniref:Phosphoglycerate mutase-like protein AT74H n=1 Tax=Porphyridium purpureum TaxID=35688 RepID=A0A5J4Z7B1_PORPP|nr:Phosphoglycerate mutase-like protein AT74H [Porphyridium purpureum]|eukprot:POR3472..scf295_1